MPSRTSMLAAFAAAALTTGAVTAAAAAGQAGDRQASPTEGQFKFTPLASSSPCTFGGNPAAPVVLPPGYTQEIFAREGDGGTTDLWDMNTQNETGPDAGRLLYRTHETSTAGQVSVTDLDTNVTRVLASRWHWERMDGVVWQRRTKQVFAAEETPNAAHRDPRAPQSTAGLVYQIDPVTGDDVPLPAVGSRAHEGMRFDPEGNLYGISETSRSPASGSTQARGGFIYRFVPDVRGDYSEGQLYALKVLDEGTRSGDAVWIPLDRAAVQVNSDAEAAARGATGWDRPEDVEIATSTGNDRSGQRILYVAVTGEDKVLAIDLREPGGGADHRTAFVQNYVQGGVNAPGGNEFDSPDNLALDHNGTLFITEDPGGTYAQGKRFGDDVWAATPGSGEHDVATGTFRFASLNDCDAEPTGIYFDKTGAPLYVNIQHRGGDGQDLAVKILPPQTQSQGTQQP